jgi:hypothetical protein
VLVVVLLPVVLTVVEVLVGGSKVVVVGMTEVLDAVRLGCVGAAVSEAATGRRLVLSSAHADAWG